MEPLPTQPPWVMVPAETIIKTCYAGPINSSCEEAVAGILQLKSYKFDLADACIVDFFVTVIWWGKEHHLTADQAALVLELARKQLVDIKVNNSSEADSIRDLKMATSDIVARASNNSLSIPLDKLGEFVKFMNNMLIQHHKLWQFYFHRLHDETVICKKYVVETAPAASVPWPPPLNEGCPEMLYRTYINPSMPPSTAAQPTNSQPHTAAPPTPHPDIQQLKITPSTTPLPKTQEGTPKDTAKPSVHSTKGGSTIPSTTPEEIDRIQLAAQKALLLDKTLIRRIVENTSRDVAQIAEQEILSKIREKENAFLTKINQIHKTATD